jgi:hypothetical protein
MIRVNHVKVYGKNISNRRNIYKKSREKRHLGVSREEVPLVWLEHSK